jgi:hypothetical protein
MKVKENVEGVNWIGNTPLEFVMINLFGEVEEISPQRKIRTCKI